MCAAMAAKEAPERLSFAAAAQQKTEDVPLRAVQIEGHVVFKIIKHCRECMPSLVTGQLLGLDIGATLESRGDDEEGAAEADSASYQLEMMRCLREVNVDNNTVGWYQSTVLGSFQTIELIDTFVNYAESIKQCICIIYDPQRYASGGLALKAVKLREKFMKVYKAGNLTVEKLKDADIAWKDIFEEIPIVVHTSDLTKALMATIEPDAPATVADFERLQLNAVPLMEKNLEYLNESLDDIVMEQQKVSFYHRNLARQQQQQAQWLQKRRQENAARRLAGEEPLPEDDPALFKPLPEPSPLDGFLLSNQVAIYCEQVTSVSKQSLEKLHLVSELQKSIV